MSTDHALPTSRRRRLAWTTTLGLVLGLGAPTLATGPASAQPVPQARHPYCYAAGFSEPPGVRPYATTWSHVGSRTTNGYTYRYWMVERVGSSALYYDSSFVATCSGDSLVSTSVTMTPTNAAGTPKCTSTGDLTVGTGVRERFTGQRVSRAGSPVVLTVTFRYWHREAQYVDTGLQWNYQSSSVVMC